MNQGQEAKEMMTFWMKTWRTKLMMKKKMMKLQNICKVKPNAKQDSLAALAMWPKVHYTI